MADASLQQPIGADSSSTEIRGDAGIKDSELKQPLRKPTEGSRPKRPVKGTHTIESFGYPLSCFLLYNSDRRKITTHHIEPY